MGAWLNILFIVILVSIIVMEVAENGHPIRTLSWILLFIFLPVVGLVLYFFFGRDRKNRRPVIVNMEELEGSCAQRVLDFLLGAIYAINGTINKISRGIFLVAPRDVDVEDTGEDSYQDM